LLEAVIQSGKPLLVISEDVKAKHLQRLFVNKLRGGFEIAAVKGSWFRQSSRNGRTETSRSLTGGQVMIWAAAGNAMDIPAPLSAF
jgi:chaperonin GroEL